MGTRGKLVKALQIPAIVLLDDTIPIHSCRAIGLSMRLELARAILPFPVAEGSYLVDPASSHMLVSKIKPCMSKYKLLIL